MNSTAVLTHREKMVRYIEEMRDGGAFEDKHVADGGRGYVGKGRGMVFTAGNADTLQRVLYTLKLVRKCEFSPTCPSVPWIIYGRLFR